MPRRVADPGRWRAVLPVRIPVPDTACGPTDTPDEPWTEALALTRGPRFDREHLGRLLGQGAAALLRTGIWLLHWWQALYHHRAARGRSVRQSPAAASGGGASTRLLLPGDRRLSCLQDESNAAKGQSRPGATLPI